MPLRVHVLPEPDAWWHVVRTDDGGRLLRHEASGQEATTEAARKAGEEAAKRIEEADRTEKERFFRWLEE